MKKIKPYINPKLNTPHMVDLLQVLPYKMRKDVKAAIEADKLLIVDPEDPLHKALISKLKQYKIAYMCNTKVHEVE